MSFHIVIPARYASTRLPGKPLADIAGKPMLQHVYERAQATQAKSVIIATDDQRIKDAAQAFGAKVCWTRPEHQSGTERIAEVIAQLGYRDDEIVVNLQGDLPFIAPQLIQQTAMVLAENNLADLATLCEKIHSREELFNPNVVKVVRDKNNFALYFSRAPIAWDRENFADTNAKLISAVHHYRHIGLYAYRVAAIKRYVALPACELEQTEALEQLRVLWHGGKIYVAEAIASVPVEVDTESDLIKARAICHSV